MNKKICRHCGKEFFIKKAGRIIHCSEICKKGSKKDNQKKYYNRNRDYLLSYQKEYQKEYRLKKLPTKRHCRFCSKTFIATTKGQFCSDACRKEKIKIDGEKRSQTDYYKEQRRLWKLKNRDKEKARRAKSRQREKKLIAFAEEIIRQTGVNL